MKESTPYKFFIMVCFAMMAMTTMMCFSKIAIPWYAELVLYGSLIAMGISFIWFAKDCLE